MILVVLQIDASLSLSNKLINKNMKKINFGCSELVNAEVIGVATIENLHTRRAIFSSVGREDFPNMKYLPVQSGHRPPFL